MRPRRPRRSTAARSCRCCSIGRPPCRRRSRSSSPTPCRCARAGWTLPGTTPGGPPGTAPTSAPASRCPRDDAPTAAGAPTGLCHHGRVTDDHLPHDFAKDATEHTQAANSRPVPPFDPADFDRVSRGLIAQHPTGVIEGPIGPAWDLGKWSFIQQGAAAPDTVNPSLWRQAQLNCVHGLFEVAPGCWQARGYDISNITFIEGTTGWVIVDPLTCTQTAAACLELANNTLGARPVTGVIYTHSHLDHFGGVLGVTTQADVDAGRCVVVAPEHFMRETVAENLLAGMAMTRRSLYQFGPLLLPGPRGQIDAGLGKGVPLGTPSLIPPTVD
ncbi:MAG: MBL fold metallo-hydrolase, partial [Ilumatobacter sp.]|nr:MBL fold metallo-hydrolase [Ilumatobacter sp.]